MRKKTTSLAIIMALVLVTLLSGFTNYSGIGDVSYEASQKIGPGTTYTYMVGNNSAAGGIVSVHVIDADVVSGKVKPYVYNGLVRKTYTLSSMSNIISNEGYKVVAGVNADIYDMSTASTRGAVVHDGILYTGGYQTGYLLSFDQSGKASVSTQKINYSVKYQKYVYENVAATPSEGQTTDAADTTNTEVKTEVKTSIQDAVTNAGYFNVPHGGANALHIFNSRYADTTKTSGTCAEVVLTLKEGSRADLKIGSVIEAVVSSVNPKTKSTAIKDNQLVLSANSSSASYNDLCNMVPGSTVTISVTTDEGSPLANAKEAVGVYNVLAYNGTVWTTDKTLNPRTCIGIKSDGSMVLFVVDGRQNTVSRGMNAIDITSYLMSLGCVTVVNMDGGGSTTIVARDEPGISDSAELINSPSDKSQRSITNALFFVYTTQDSAGAAGIAVYPVSTLMLPGMSVQLSSYGVNSLYEKASLPGAVTYSVDSAYGTVDASGVFTADKNASGEAVITATSGELTGTAKVNIVKDITFGLNKTSATLGAGESCDFNVTSVRYGNSQVLYRDDLFTWSCSPEIGTIDQNGLFKATDQIGEFSGKITVAAGNKSFDIAVKVESSGEFKDISSHWAKLYINELVNAGIIKGMTATAFQPDGNLTRAQFLTLLSKISGNDDVTAAPAASFSDVAKGSWYYDCVNWGVANGIVKGMGDGSFAPDANVSREQMCVMLNNYYTYKGIQWENSETELTFSDKKLVSDWALASVKKVVSEDIMSGRTDGSFDPLGKATRAEAAKIVYLVKEIYEYQMTD